MVGENAHITAPQRGAGHHIFAPAARAHVVSLSPSPTGIDTHVVRGTVNGVNESTYNDIPDSAFRWSSGIWIFNMATGNLDKNATYSYRIALKNGSFVYFTAGTK
jgi:hypothetical protein